MVVFKPSATYQRSLNANRRNDNTKQKQFQLAFLNAYIFKRQTLSGQTYIIKVQHGVKMCPLRSNIGCTDGAKAISQTQNATYLHSCNRETEPNLMLNLSHYDCDVLNKCSTIKEKQQFYHFKSNTLNIVTSTMYSAEKLKHLYLIRYQLS